DGNTCDHADWADAKVAGPETAVSAVTSEIFSAASGFSDTQGGNGWSYLDSTGASLAYRPASSPGLDAVLEGSEKYLLVSRDGGHPGDDKGSVRRWTAPQAGAVRITGNVHDGDPACGGGVTVLIKKGEISLWPRASATETSPASTSICKPQSNK